MGSQAPVIASVLVGVGGGPSNGSMNAGMPRFVVIGAGERAMTPAGCTREPTMTAMAPPME